MASTRSTGGRAGSSSSRIPAALAAGALVLHLAVSVVAGAQDVSAVDDVAYLGFYLALLVSFAVVGMSILRRHPGHTIGWMFMGLTLFIPITGAAADVAALLDRHDLSEWIGSWSWVPVVVVPLIFVPLLFPDGHLPTPRWAPVAWLTGLGAAGLFIDMMFGPFLGGVEEYGPNPYHHPEIHRFAGVLAFLIIPGVLGSVAAAVVRYRRSRGVSRQQMKWFALGVLFLMIVLVSVSALSALAGLDEGVANLLVLSAVVGLPVTVALGIVRYRLYDIDRLLSRSVAYPIVAGMLFAVYAGGVTLLGLLPSFGNDLSVAASTLTAAFLFQPLRNRVMRWVERRFHRLPYDPESVLLDLRSRLQHLVDTDLIVGEFGAVVQGALEPALVGVWISGSSNGHVEERPVRSEESLTFA